MNTLAALDHYNSLCDELDSFMHEENSQLRFQIRKRVMAKILKLLLLSRESEQLLLKHSVMTAPRMEQPKATPARLANTYKTRKTPVKGTSQAEGSWAVW